MINIADLPAVRAQFERDVASATDVPAPRDQAVTVEYARAPAAPGPQQTGGRPPATQGGTR